MSRIIRDSTAAFVRALLDREKTRRLGQTMTGFDSSLADALRDLTPTNPTEHQISAAGGDGDDFPCCTVTFPHPLEPGHIRTEDYTLTELFGWYDGLPYCQECGVPINREQRELHRQWHNKLLP